MRHLTVGSDDRVFDIETGESYYPAIPLIPCGRQEVLTAAAPAVGLDCYLTVLDATSNGVASTLADGVWHGQLKKIQARVVSGGTTNVTLASAESASLDVITFSVIGDWCLLMWYKPTRDSTGYWLVLERNDEDGDVDTPAIA